MRRRMGPAARPPAALPPRRTPFRLPPVLLLWLFNAGICAAASIAFLTGAANHQPLSELHVDWWWVAIAIAVAERWPVKLEFRRASHAFSLTDIPLTLAIVFASGADAVLGVTAGAALTMAFARLGAVKAVFNVAQFGLAASIGLLVFHLIAGPDPTFGPAAWAGAFVATQIGGLVTITLIATAIRISEGALPRAELREMYAMDAVVTCTNTSLALLAALVLIADPAAIPILVVPVLFAFLGYRAYVKARERGEKLAFLYETNRAMLDSHEFTSALEGLLEHAREAFRVEVAEVVLLGDGGTAARTAIGPGDEREVRAPADADAVRALCDLARDAPVALRSTFPAALDPLLGGRSVREAMAAVLVGETGPVGLLLLANRVGVGRGFGHDDLALFEALATSASAALRDDGLEGAVNELLELQHQMRHQTHHDALTGLPNRTLFSKEVAAAVREDRVAVLLADLDDFKTVNDSFGHDAGDELLCAAATRISRAVRTGDLVARLGGDEFAVLLRAGGGDLDAAAAELAQRILNAFDLPVALDERLLSVGLSVGIATAPAGDDPSPLLRDADVAMYTAKGSGKHRFAVFTSEMRDQMLQRQATMEALRTSIERGDLHVQYQPIVDLATGEMVAAEALVRWDHPTRGRVSPAEFIPLAEETGLIAPLGRVVLRKACAQGAEWMRQGNPPIDIQVNLSGLELEDPDLIDSVCAALRETGLPPHRLVLELTETVLVRDAVRGGEMLARLRALGVKLALDDFGTGYSSLSYLRSLPLDVLKIAKEFVDGITDEAQDVTVVRLVVELAAQRGLRVIAEGIETEAQGIAARKLGCDLGQGYFFARPLDGDDPALSVRPAVPRS